MMGIGIAEGENRALDAATQATNSRLLESSIAGASRVLFSIAGGPELTLNEVNEAAMVVEQCADDNANIIYGQIIDPSMGDKVRITVIATGFKTDGSRSRSDLFATPAPASAPASSAPAYAAPAASTSTGRFADEDYIPDFLKRQN